MTNIQSEMSFMGVEREKEFARESQILSNGLDQLFEGADGLNYGDITQGHIDALKVFNAAVKTALAQTVQIRAFADAVREADIASEKKRKAELRARKKAEQRFSA